MSGTRAGLRFFSNARASFQKTFQQTKRRFASGDTALPKQETSIPNPNQQQSGFGRVWNSPVGPKTVHFWAPIMKWGLVLSGISDFARPAESLSLTQNLALTMTGAIWTRWCFIIKPRNIALAAVNFFLFLVGVTQVSRILMYQQSLKNDPLSAEVKKAAKQEKGDAEKIIKDPKGAAQNAGLKA